VKQNFFDLSENPEIKMKECGDAKMMALRNEIPNCTNLKTKNYPLFDKSASHTNQKAS